MQRHLSELAHSSEAIIIENDDERWKQQIKLVNERRQQLKNIQVVSQLIFQNGIKIAPNDCVQVKAQISFHFIQSSNDNCM